MHNQSYGEHAPHLHEPDWRRPVSLNTAWLLVAIVLSVFSGVAGWILHGVLR